MCQEVQSHDFFARSTLGIWETRFAEKERQMRTYVTRRRHQISADQWSLGSFGVKSPILFMLFMFMFLQASLLFCRNEGGSLDFKLKSTRNENEKRTRNVRFT